MPRYVILRHDTPAGHARPLHWDFLLEGKAALRAWALLSEPVPHTTIAAEQLLDHRKEYLQYEGPISGGRGEVAKWDEGEFEWEKDQESELVVRLAGQRFQGQATATRTAGEDQRWQFRFTPDR